MKKKVFVLLATIVGLLLPFGNMWLPLLVNGDAEFVAFRKKIILSQVVIYVIFMAVNVAFWTNEMMAIVDGGTRVDGNHMLWTLAGYVLAVVLFAIGGIVLLWIKRR